MCFTRFTNIWILNDWLWMQSLTWGDSTWNYIEKLLKVALTTFSLNIPIQSHNNRQTYNKPVKKLSFNQDINIADYVISSWCHLLITDPNICVCKQNNSDKLLNYASSAIWGVTQSQKCLQQHSQCIVINIDQASPIEQASLAARLCDASNSLLKLMM